MKDIIKYKKGFTLVEVIIGLAFVGIISVVFLEMFMVANSIYEKSSELDYVSSKAPLAISGDSVEGIQTTKTQGTLVINFSDTQISVNGNFSKGNKENGTNESITTFNPNP